MIQKQIEQDFLTAFKGKDEKSVSTLRMLKSALTNKIIEKRMAKDQVLDDGDVMAIVKSEIKKRKDSIESYQQADRNDLAQKESEEMAILERYLPEQLSEDQVRKEICEIISQSGYGASDFGKAMGAVMARVGSKADGQLVSKILKEELSK
ncbi:MAG: GatB/YqeY domain-containing protein [Candidatus Buchananbacteria bacterium]